MDRMKLMAGVIALLTVFGVAGCNRSPGTNTSDQTMGRSGGGAGGGSATSPQSGGSSANAPSDNTGGSSGAPSGGAGR